MYYEPPTVAIGATFQHGQEPQLAPGVRGYAMELHGLILIPLIIAEQEGNGDAGRFIDSLSPRCAFLSVYSPRLAGMLKRRGWVRIDDFWIHQSLPWTAK